MANRERTNTNQIAIVMTNKKLVAFYDKLKVAPIEAYAQLHAKRDDVNGVRQTSLIGIQVYDYSNGTGDKNIKVEFNLEPEQIQFLLTRLTAGFMDYEWNSDKIFGQPDASGYATVQKFLITRHQVDQNGNPLKNPWRIFIQNGKGIKVQNSNGGAYMKGGSFVCEKQANIALTDMDMYMLLKRTDSYISAWEQNIASVNIVDGKRLYDAYVQQQRAANSQYQTNYAGNYQAQAQQAAPAPQPTYQNYQAAGTPQYNGYGSQQYAGNYQAQAQQAAPAPQPVAQPEQGYGATGGYTPTNSYGQPVE